MITVQIDFGDAGKSDVEIGLGDIETSRYDDDYDLALRFMDAVKAHANDWPKLLAAFDLEETTVKDTAKEKSDE